LPKSAAAPLPPPPEGLIVELVTPLRADGRLDGEGLFRLVERVALAADGLLAGGPGVGEALDLPLKTRRDLLTQLLDTVAGRVPLFFGVTGCSWEETRTLAAALLEEGRKRHYSGAVYLVDLPLYWHSNRGLPQAYQLLLQEVPLPLVVFNLPEVVRGRAPRFKHRNIRTHVFKKIAALNGVVGLIYRGEMHRFLNYHAAASRRPGFAFYEGDEANFLTRPGAWGVLSAGAQLLPEAWQRVVRACLHPEEAVPDQERRLELWDLSHRLLEIAKLCRANPAALLKTALTAQGVLAQAATASDTPAAPESQKQALLNLLAPLTV